ncbi:MAG: nitrilase-related carbon-nitrogen hydrolase [Psychrobacter sp.]|nr:nitrilase-related carbon-nitrogen hydrolase [Psychrobacter sp.]
MTKPLDKPPIVVAAIQLNSQQDIDANLVAISAAVAEASAKGAKLIVLPENTCSMGQQRETAQRFDELSAYMADLAKQHQVHLVAGTLPCLNRPDGSSVAQGRLRQVSQVFGPTGSLLARYDKIHLFTATVNDEHSSYNEAATFEPGTQTVTALLDIDGHCYPLGLMVCFDLRFPALAQRLRQAGAELLCAPSAFTYLTGKAHWRLLLQARALDSQCLVIGAAQGGSHRYPQGPSRQTWGHAAIMAHDGSCMSEYEHSDLAGAQNRHKTQPPFATVLATFDPKAQREARANLPIFDCHRLA